LEARKICLQLMILAVVAILGRYVLMAHRANHVWMGQQCLRSLTTITILCNSASVLMRNLVQIGLDYMRGSDESSWAAMLCILDQ